MSLLGLHHAIIPILPAFPNPNFLLTAALHNVYIVQYVFLPTEKAETYLKIYVLIYHSTYICPSLFIWKENLIFKETVTFKL